MFDKMYLKDKMDQSYLIQRLAKPIGTINPFSFGGGLVNGGLSKGAMEILKEIFSFDYMGAAEFEWGAVPAAIKFIAEQAGEKGEGVVSGEHCGVYYICPKSYEAGVKDVVNNLLANESAMRLKEYCGLKEAITPRVGPGSYRKNIVGWLELNNGFFFFTDHEMFENTKRLFGIE